MAADEMVACEMVVDEMVAHEMATNSEMFGWHLKDVLLAKLFALRTG